MKAVIWTHYGPPEVLELREIERPAPRDSEILVKVAVSNVFPGDCELRRFDVGFPWSWLVRAYCGLLKPRPGARLGQEYAGEVVAVGKDVTRFKPGDRIFGALESLGRGSYAEYVTTSGKAATTMPAALSFEQAAAATIGGLHALHFLRVAQVHEGGPRQKVLMIGAAGSIGTMAVQLACAFGAEVTAVDTTHKLEPLRQLGAHHVIDFTKEDFASRGPIYDVVIDIVGRNVAGGNPLSRTLRAVKPGGCLVLGNAPFHQLLATPWARLFSKRKVHIALVGYQPAELERLKALIESGKVKPVVERRYPMQEVVEAHRYVETGQRIGNVVLTAG